MTTNDLLAACLSKIDNSERVSKGSVVMHGTSSDIKHVLKILAASGYIETPLIEENAKGGKITIPLKGTINRCGAIKPRFKVSVDDIERYEQRFLPAKSFGILILSTSKGMMTNIEAREKNIGGRLVAYCY